MNGKGIDDTLLISTAMTTSALEKGVNLYKVYIDLKRAYDRVSRKILRLIKAMHDGVFVHDYLLSRPEPQIIFCHIIFYKHF